MNKMLSHLLRCPRCKNQLDWGDDLLTCNACPAKYGISDSKIPVFDLYVDDHQEEMGRDPDQTWDLNTFEETYKVSGYHECGSEFDERLGYPQIVSEFLFERVKKRMLQWVKPAEGHTILDVGCGAGYFLNLIREKYQTNGFTPIVTGSDISTAQLSYMVQRMQKEGVKDAVAVHGNGEYLPFADESFDLVTCSEVIEHIRNPERALTEMNRVLKPSGVLLLSTPSMTAQKGWGIALAPVAALVKIIIGYKSDPKTKEEGYDIPWYPEDFKKSIRSASFEIQDFEYNAIIPHPWHFKFLSKPLISPLISIFKFVDKYCKPFLKSLALHFVVRVRKLPVQEQVKNHS